MYCRIRRQTISFLAILLLCLWALPAGAVDKGKTSFTAESVCAFRSIAALDPDPKTRNPDQLAKLFVNRELQNRIPGMGLAYDDAKIAMDGMQMGTLYWVNARTHHMDAKLVQALNAGFQQVLIMGAGFDSRAYRFHDDYPDVRFFEVDLPATSLDKQRRVEKILGHRPDWVTYVPIDFNTQTLDEVLANAGFDLKKRAFYIWEGVTYYISEAGVDSTLRFVAEKSAPGSQIIFDYMLEAVVKGLDYSPYGAKRTVFMIANSGEPFVFGIDPNHLQTYINRYGLVLLSDLAPSELTRQYLIQSNGKTSGRIAGFMHIAHCLVPGTTQRVQLRNNAKSQSGTSEVKQTPSKAVNVPDDVKAFMASFSRNLKNKNFPAILEQHSDKFLAYGHTRDQTIGILHQVYQHQPIHQFEIMITRFDRQGDKAKMDGYVQRRGFRTPLMINDIIKEADGQWRMYGDQQ